MELTKLLYKSPSWINNNMNFLLSFFFCIFNIFPLTLFIQTYVLCVVNEKRKKNCKIFVYIPTAYICNDIKKIYVFRYLYIFMFNGEQKNNGTDKKKEKKKNVLNILCCCCCCWLVDLI